MYLARLVAMEATSDLAPLAVAAQRLRFAQLNAGWDGSPALDPVFDNLNALLAAGTLKESVLPILEEVVALSEKMPTHAQTDTFAQRLVGFAPGGRRSMELALAVPATPASVTPVITSGLDAMSGPDFISVAKSHRSQLADRDVKVTELAAAKWAAGNGKDYLEVAITADDPAQLDALFQALKVVADPTAYVSLMPGLSERLAALDAAEGSSRMLAAVVTRISSASLSYALLEQLASPVAVVQHLADPVPLVTAVAGVLASAPRAEIPATTSVAMGFVAAGVRGAEGLPPVVADHASAEGTMDLDNVNWLIKQPGVNADNVILGLRSAIKAEPHAKVRAAIEGMNKNRRGRWAIGKALVERAAEEPSGSRLDWLEDALASGAPSRKHNPTEHGEYEDALNRAVEGDAATDDIVRRLRNRL